MNEEKIPLIMHLSDLKRCIIKSILGLVICMGICYGFAIRIMEILQKPIIDKMPQNSKLVVLSPQEYFFCELKLALFFGFILSLPYMLSQVWQFISPGLYKNEKKFLYLFIVFASIFFVLGILFSYFLILPIVFEYFISSMPKSIMGYYSVDMVYGFATSIMMAFGLAFETPLAIFLLIYFGFISIETFKSYRRHMFVASFVLGALLTPPDPLSQVMLAIPVYLLFELGLLVSGFSVKKNRC